MIRRTTHIAFVILLAGLLAACLPQPETVTVQLEAEDIKWSQTEIEVEVGQELFLIIENKGVLDHDFVIDALDIEVRLLPGDVQEISLTFEEPGVIEFHCAVPGHLDAGMQGVITVTEP
ncbi:MAG: cupredoxin domain-containing protein [Chloroflexi bacterium]|nr:cupredoxin domain-containing protein [Chloroflexota bacterium]